MTLKPRTLLPAHLKLNMADFEIEQWHNSGAISIWHYEDFPKNYHGYHLMADQTGCDFLRGLVERFRKARYPARKKFALRPPTRNQLAVPNCSKKCLPARNVEFRFRHEFDKAHWMISEKSGELVIELGTAGLQELDRGVSDMTQGRGDWAMGGASKALWFWWHPAHGT